MIIVVRKERKEKAKRKQFVFRARILEASAASSAAAHLVCSLIYSFLSDVLLSINVPH